MMMPRQESIGLSVRLKLVLPVLLLGLLVPAAARAGLDSQLQGLVRASDLRSTRVGLYAIDADTGEQIISLNADEPMVPASNMKLVTSAAALGTLGPDFMFRTELRLVRPQHWADPAYAAGAAADPRALGDVLVVHGDGDPAFCDARMLEQFGGEINTADKLIARWVELIQQAGVRRVQTLLVDDRIFDDRFVHESWPADQLNEWYCAQVAGLNFYTNCLDVFAAPQAAGQSPRVELYPDASFISTINSAVSGGADTFWIHRLPGSNDLTFRGKIKSRRREPIHVTIHDPPMFFGQLLAQQLRAAGVTVERVARPAADDRMPAGQVLHVVQTGLKPVINRCNKDSQNLYAEALLKRIGRQLTGAPGSWESGAAAVRIFLTERMGTDASIVQVADGSGLSRDNRVTARTLVELLAAMHRDPQLGPAYRESLSIGGADGTLHKRFGGELAGQVYGKSGYIRQVSTLSGYIVAPSVPGDAAANEGAARPRTVAFSLLFNDMPPKVYVHHIKALQDKIVTRIDRDLAEEAQSVRLGG